VQPIDERVSRCWGAAYRLPTVRDDGRPASMEAPRLGRILRQYQTALFRRYHAAAGADEFQDSHVGVAPSRACRRDCVARPLSHDATRSPPPPSICHRPGVPAAGRVQLRRACSRSTETRHHSTHSPPCLSTVNSRAITSDQPTASRARPKRARSAYRPRSIRCIGPRRCPLSRCMAQPPSACALKALPANPYSAQNGSRAPVRKADHVAATEPQWRVYSRLARGS
jgi:hypothetical protein